jgi:hypothetical protein
MTRICRLLSSACFAAALLIPVANIGCAGRVRIYDQYHSDYHRWDHNEDLAYRQYLGESHQPYRAYGKLNKDEQRDYWNWRHSHPDNESH